MYLTCCCKHASVKKQAYCLSYFPIQTHCVITGLPHARLVGSTSTRSSAMLHSNDSPDCQLHGQCPGRQQDRFWSTAAETDKIIERRAAARSGREWSGSNMKEELNSWPTLDVKSDRLIPRTSPPSFDSRPGDGAAEMATRPS